MTTKADAAAVGIFRIKPHDRWFSLHSKELWEYRELLYFLVWRDLKVRYKQTLLGVAWVVIQPLVVAAIFALLFGRVAGLPSEGMPYLLYAFSGLVLWQLFGGGLTRAGLCLVGSANLITKVYFPRLLFPLAAVVSGIVDFSVGFVVLLGLMLWYGVGLSWTLFLIPIFVALTMLATVALGLWLAALNVQYRDVQHGLPFLVQVLMLLSPVAYAGSVIPQGRLSFLFHLNPMDGLLQGFRWALFGTPAPGVFALASMGIVIIVGLSGLVYFRHAEITFADIV